MIPVELMAFDHLITKDKLEPSDVLEECLTPVTQFTTRAFADCNIVDLKQGTVIQLSARRITNWTCRIRAVTRHQWCFSRFPPVESRYVFILAGTGDNSRTCL
jgi:hypothetical protein